MSVLEKEGVSVPMCVLINTYVKRKRERERERERDRVCVAVDQE